MLKYIAAVCLTTSWLFSANGFAAEPANHAAVLAPFVNQDSFGVAYVDIASLDLPKDEKAILPPQLLLVMKGLPAEVQAQMFLVGGAEVRSSRIGSRTGISRQPGRGLRHRNHASCRRR